MDLKVCGLRLTDFRSYRELYLDGLTGLTIFVGPNAIGKSNLLEAIQLTTALTSFRNATSDQMIRWGCEEAGVKTYISDGIRELEVSLLLNAGGRRYQLNGKPVAASSLRDTLPAVSFSPDDLSLVKGSPSTRRAALDSLGGQLSSNYRSVKRDYDKLIRQKNHLLKDEVQPAYLESVDEVLSVVGAQLCRYRLQIIADLQKEFPVQYSETTAAAEEAQISYCLSWENRTDSAGDFPKIVDTLATEGIPPREELQEAFCVALQDAREEERVVKRALVGPHRDTFDFLLNGYPATHYASQGQQRSLAICFKLTEFFLLERRHHQKPILLLDDVMSEIDATRRSMLIGWLQKSSQTFITTTNMDYFTPDIIEQAHVIPLPYTLAKSK